MKIAKGQEIMYLEAKQQLTDHRAFLQEVKSFNPSFGRAWAASGFRNGKVLSIQNGQHQSSTNHDWALIEVPRERIGSNIVSSTAGILDAPYLTLVFNRLQMAMY